MTCQILAMAAPCQKCGKPIMDDRVHYVDDGMWLLCDTCCTICNKLKPEAKP